jgi:hypothetical protein
VQNLKCYIRDSVRPGEQGRSEANRQARKDTGAVRLGEVLQEFMDNHVLNRQGYIEVVAQVFSQVLPSGLVEHCQIAGLFGGQLKIAVDSAAYMYELQLCSSQLLGELSRQHPRIPVEKIKVSLA